MEGAKKITFLLRVIHNQIKLVIHRSAPQFRTGPKSHLQGGILHYLYHHRDQPVYQRDLEKEFRISRATATNALQVMEREGLVVRRADERDGRLKQVQMTEEALGNHRQLEERMEQMGRQLLEGISEEEAAELYRLLEILMRNLEKMAAELGGPPEGDWEEGGGPHGRPHDRRFNERKCIENVKDARGANQGIQEGFHPDPGLHDRRGHHGDHHPPAHVVHHR